MVEAAIVQAADVRDQVRSSCRSCRRRRSCCWRRTLAASATARGDASTMRPISATTISSFGHFPLRFTTMGRKPVTETNTRHPRPAHVTLAVVLQVRDGELQALLWQRARAPFAGQLGAAGRLPRARATPRATRSAGTSRRRSTCASSRTSSSWRRWADPKRRPQAVAAGDGLPRARAAAMSTRPSRRTRAGTRSRRPPAPRVRPRLDRCSRAGTACARSCRTRTSASRSRRGVHHLRAPRPLRGGARTRRVGDESAASPAPARGARSRPTAGGRRARRAARPGVPLPLPYERGWRSPISSQC